jgi:hypothetical protein
LNPRILAGLLAFAALAVAVPGADPAPVLPAGYKLLYAQKFGAASSLADFVMSDPAAWQWSGDPQGGSLELARQSDYKPAVRSPFNLAVLKDRVFTDFILEAEMLQTSKEYGHRDMVICFGFNAPAKFYYAHIATAADDHAHNVFIVNNQPRVKIARETTKGVDWGREVWQKVRLERRGSDGPIKVYFGDLTKPIMLAEDKTFPSGYLGFGSFDDTGKIRNVRIWGAPLTTKPGPSFGKP